MVDTLLPPEPIDTTDPTDRRGSASGPGRRRRRSRPRPGEQSAGRVLAMMLGGLALAALVNADAMVERAESKPFGPGRDRSLMLWHPVQDLAHITQLHRIRDLADVIVGNEDQGSDDPVAAIPGPDADGDVDADDDPVPEPAEVVRPILRQPTAADPLRVYIGGDSVVRDAGESFLRLAADRPLLAPHLHYKIASGLTRPDFYDWPAAIASDAQSIRPDVALIMFGGNDAQGIVGADGTVHPEVDSPGWRAEYGRRVGGVMDELRAEGRLVLWIGQPPMRDSGFDARIDVINEVVAAEAADRPWVTFVDTATVLGGPDGSYTDRVEGVDDDLRQGDGIHLSRAGADRLAAHLIDLIEAELATTGSTGSTGTTASTSSTATTTAAATGG